jgi:hypothetical protein
MPFNQTVTCCDLPDCTPFFCVLGAASASSRNRYDPTSVDEVTATAWRSPAVLRRACVKTPLLNRHSAPAFLEAGAFVFRGACQNRLPQPLAVVERGADRQVGPAQGTISVR